MSAQFFYKIDSEVHGPVDADQLKLLAAQGTLLPDTLIRKGTGPWVPARNASGLFGENVKDESAVTPPIPLACETEWAIKTTEIKESLDRLVRAIEEGNQPEP